ncbi:7386_t:CDS:2 [Entrophospora sp. SA101]|nr:7386_t:CDS:2 [Entrophospora sp. SA101]CAJ0910438.1 17744_t:CDS:2 [Entrophospora sp. SA101]CAJ0910462.1 17752_t:CDS:2 [Entrophospora sp. SA101]
MPKIAHQSLSERLITLVKHPQFTWWCGHLIMLFCTFFYCFNWITFNSERAASYYYIAYLGSMLSYGVVVYKVSGKPSLSYEYLRKINKDENIFYLILALNWYFNTPVTVTLFPYATFSLFHFVTYLRLNILTTFFPPPSTPPQSSPSQPRALSITPAHQWAIDLSKWISLWVQNNHEPAMKYVSLVEVVVIPLTLLWNVITYLDNKLLPPTASKKIPPYVTSTYKKLRAFIIGAGQYNPQHSFNTRQHQQ